MEKNILIASASLDEHAYGPVADILERRGFSAIVYRTDQVLADEERLFIDIASDGNLTIDYGGNSIAPDHVGAAWYRKLGNFALSDAANDTARQLYVHTEIRHLHDSIWSLYPDDLWLNAPERIRQADSKLRQLVVAHELGFSVPETLIGSDWGGISARLLSRNNRMVVKMMRGIISEKDEIRAVYTTDLDEDKINQIRDHTTPFPGIYQPFIEKTREWRVTIVGDEVFPAAIYTDDIAKTDWRMHQLTDAVRFEKEALPVDIAEKCLRYVGRMGLKFGAFDFIENPDGEVIFLECNPNGQYGWLEQELGFPISDSIASQLIKIARRS